MRFFFYGTLIAGGANPMARLVADRLRPIGPATVHGLLHAIPDVEGWYPALLAGGGTVHGALYEAGAAFRDADLARIDAYEDYDPADPAASLYVRTVLQAAPPAGEALPAQAYLFNRSLPAGSRPIAGGDFRAWLAADGLRAFGE